MSYPNNSLEYINGQYGLNAAIDDRVTYLYGLDEDAEPEPNGTIVGSDGGHFIIVLDGEKHLGRYHPTWQLICHKQPDIGE